MIIVHLSGARLEEKKITGGLSAVALYDRLRYPPSDQVLAWLLSGQEGGPVLDLASGTGQIARRLTDDFIGRGGAVFALEPDPRMRRALRARVPRATVIDGTAESIPLATASIDTVLAGSAWHWFSESRAPGEIARVLRDGGVLGVLGTTPDISVHWSATCSSPKDCTAWSARSRPTSTSGCLRGTSARSSTPPSAAGSPSVAKTSLSPSRPTAITAPPDRKGRQRS